MLLTQCYAIKLRYFKANSVECIAKLEWNTNDVFGAAELYLTHE